MGGATRDLTGERFGDLVVLEKADGLQNRYYTWRCRCDCGKEVIVNTRNLTANRTTHCGCKAKDRISTCRHKDRTGIKYGALTALRLKEITDKGEYMWECECECGKHTLVPAKQLERKTIKDCGCGIGERPRYKDISGQKKGQLTALYPTYRRDNRGSVIWKCRCDCGNVVEISESDFVFGGSVSCGCVRQQRLDEFLPSDLLTFVDGTCVEWIANRKRRSDNSSGFRGVYKTGNNNYRVSIGLQGKRYDLGRYKSFDEAVAVRLEVEKYLHDGFVSCWSMWSEKALEDKQWAQNNPFFFSVEKDQRSFRISSAMTKPVQFSY